MGRVEIVTLRVGARVKEGKGGGGGEKKYACLISLLFWETPYAGKQSSWLVRQREVDWCLSINGKSILFILGKSCVLRNEKVKAISTLVIRRRFACSIIKPTPLLLHAKMLLVPVRFFFLASRLCSTERVLCFNWANVILAACFTLRGHDTLVDFLWFLNFWSSWLMLQHFLWPLLKHKALFCCWIRLSGSLFLSKVPQDLNN